MPFEPLKPSTKPDIWKEQEPCRDPEHDPPGMVVWREDGWWVCPSCGRRVPVGPSKIKYIYDGPSNKEKWPPSKERWTECLNK